MSPQKPRTAFTHSIQPIEGNLMEMEDILDFLVSSPGRSLPKDLWRRRLTHWWIENPDAYDSSPKGWTLRHQNGIVGFLGCVPIAYEIGGMLLDAVAVSTWRVLDAHRSQSLRLFMPLFQLSRKIMVLNTSPSPVVEAVLARSAFKSECEIKRHFFALGRNANKLLTAVLSKKRGFPPISHSAQVVTDLRFASSVLPQAAGCEWIQKAVSAERLRWQLATPMESLSFVGVLDEAGALRTYLTFRREKLKGLHAWTVVDAYSACESGAELRALAGHVCRNPRLLPGSPRARILTTVSFPNDQEWDAAPAFHRRITPIKHFFTLPPDHAQAKKRCVLAEGDSLL